MIICGYQGTGKSTYCREHQDIAIDLDSSNYNKDNTWITRYITDATLYKNKKIFISAHKGVINYLLENEIEFEVLILDMSKNAWRSRLQFRYDKNPTLANLKALKDFEKNFDKDMEFYNTLSNKRIKVHKITARIITTIADVI